MPTKSLQLPFALSPKTHLHRLKTRLRHQLCARLVGVLEALRDKDDEFSTDPCDRRYIAAFLAQHATDIQGRVLEFDPPLYATQFGQVRLDVMSVEKRPGLITCDLSAATIPLPENQYDCILCTQVLGFMSAPDTAVHHLYRLLKPGGVVLLSVNAQGRLSKYDEKRYGYRTRLTPLGVRELLERTFGAHVAVEAHGNTYAAMAALSAIPAHYLDQRQLHVVDPWCPMTIVARAVKEGGQEQPVVP